MKQCELWWIDVWLKREHMISLQFSNGTKRPLLAYSLSMIHLKGIKIKNSKTVIKGFHCSTTFFSCLRPEETTSVLLWCLLWWYPFIIHSVSPNPVHSPNMTPNVRQMSAVKVLQHTDICSSGSWSDQDFPLIPTNRPKTAGYEPERWVISVIWSHRISPGAVWDSASSKKI